MLGKKEIEIKGARQNNLKNVDVKIPRDSAAYNEKRKLDYRQNDSI